MNRHTFLGLPILFLLWTLASIGSAWARQTGTVPSPRDDDVSSFYSGSYALLFGNGEYQHWDQLEWPTRDVDAIAAQLERLGFETEVHKNLESAAFQQVMAQFLATRGREENAQLLVYYAGHGHTVKAGALGDSFGYIALVDTPHPRTDYAGFEAQSIDMDWFITYAKKLTARHVLFVFDSCFSGTVLNVRAPIVPSAVEKTTRHPVRAFLTAGSADEPVPDESIFKSVLLKVLEGSIPEPIEDGYLTGDELGTLMKTEVPRYHPNQHPQYGKILHPELDSGDFVFRIPRAAPPAGESETTFQQAQLAYEAGDYEKALAAFREAAEAGHADAMNYVGAAYYDGHGVQQSFAKALEWFERAAKAGSTQAMNNLGFMYSEGEGTARDYVQSALWYGQAVQAGEPSAMFNLGHMYQLGQGVAQDDVKAAELFRQAAEAGDAEAMNNLAYAFHQGKGIEVDTDEALRWYRRAVEEGSAAAMSNLGYIYFEGKIVERDYREAFRLLTKGAEAGHQGAKTSLANMYLEGYGTAKDPARAHALLLGAAGEGHPSAMNDLGRLYEKGLGVGENLPLALRWYRQAADAGHAGAMANLGRLYETGRGVSQDEREALVWYRKAAFLGDAFAKRRIEALGGTN